MPNDSDSARLDRAQRADTGADSARTSSAKIALLALQSNAAVGAPAYIASGAQDAKAEVPAFWKRFGEVLTG